MRLSTSSSESEFANHRAPEHPWTVIWLQGVLFALLLIATAEAYWRQQGVQPSVTDSAAFWAYHRGRVGGAADRSIVVVGTSRAQLGIDVDALQSRFPEHEAIQLAIAGGGIPPAAIADLADDESFRGVLLVDIVPSWITDETWNAQQGYIEAYHHPPSPVLEFETRMAAVTESRLALLRPACGLRSLASALLLRQHRPPPSRWMAEDRFVRADFTRVDTASLQETLLEDLEQGQLETNCPPQIREQAYRRWLELTDQLAALCQRLVDRGVRVVFLRLPSSGPRVALEQVQAPRERYWDVFARRMPDECVMIHFADEPTLAGFTCPDMSHLDYRDARRFTQAVADLLIDKGVVPAAAAREVSRP